MATRTLDRPPVGFCTTSSRIAHAYRNAARHNKRLSGLAAINELGHANETRQVLAQPQNFTMVVLSHVDDDHLVLARSQVAHVGERVFHLLFTEPTTHPDQIAQWMRTTNIRSESRLHVVKVDGLDTPQVSQLLGRVCSAYRPDANRGSIIDAYLAGDTLLVRGPMHRMLHVPVNSMPALRDQPKDVLRNFQIDPDGSFIYWPGLDVHLGWKQFLQAVDPAEVRKSEQQSTGHNARYGAAIRQVREQAGIMQTSIQGLTERQLRRIEHGECRATSAAIEALAKAHKLDSNTYMERLARAMR